MIWLQHWTDVLFLHFPLAERQLQPLLPASLSLDLFDGSAWLSYVFFRLKLRPAWLPNIPAFSSLYELNVRTYVRYYDQAGIYFLRMYADNPLAIFASRLLTPLNYEPADITLCRCSDGLGNLSCKPRNSDGAIRLDFRLEPSIHAKTRRNSLDHWLIERYRAFVPRGDQSLLTATVEHRPWQTAPVHVLHYDDDLHDALGISLPSQPARSHYSFGVAARFNAFETAGIPKSAGHAAGYTAERSKEKIAGTGFEPATSRL